MNESATDKVIPDTDTAENEEEYIDVALADFSHYRSEASQTYHSLMGKQLGKYE